jgi:PIN domain nuclease of toxin-antitoxin system
LYLLDSNILIWWNNGTRLPEPCSAIIAEPSHALAVSVVTFYEVTYKQRLGKLPEAPVPVPQMARHLDANIIAITAEDAVLAATLDWQNRDPWDRLIAAQCLRLNAIFLSADRAFDLVGVKRIWA